MAGSVNRTRALSPSSDALSNSAALGMRTLNVASELMKKGVCPLTPKRMCLDGTHVTPASNDGAKIGPTRSCAAASYSGCSGAQSSRSCGHALKVTSDWNQPTSAIMPAPNRSSSIGLYANHAPGSASREPSNDESV